MSNLFDVIKLYDLVLHITILFLSLEDIIQLKVDIQMTVTWTSGYGTSEAVAFVEWSPKGGLSTRSPAGTLTFDRNSMCGV